MPNRRFALTTLALTASLLAAPAWSQTVERCSRELGTLAVAEPQSHYIAGLARYGLGSPTAMLRMIVQESGCFAVVERGVAMQNLQQERALAQSGQLQQGSNVGGGQMAAADFVMTPAVQFADSTGGVGGVVGGLLSRAGGVLGHLGGLAGGVKFKEAETTLLVADVRSSIQVASAEGKASKMDFSLGGWGWGGLGWAAAGGYSKTPEGKLIAASLLDNFNRIVVQVRDKPNLVRNNVQASQQNAALATPATPTTGAAPAAAAMRPIQAPLAPAAPMSAGGAMLSAALVGAYSGQFTGADSGIFMVVVNPDGAVSGTGQSAAGVAFKVMGMVAANGSVVLTSMGQAGTSQFSGLIGSDGTLAGTWRTTNGSAVGQFQGQRAQ